jgi:hypothetical protein
MATTHELSQYAVTEITGTDFVEQTFRLRYEIWLRETKLRAETYTQGTVKDEHDAHARHWAAFDGERIMAAARMCIHDRQEDTPDAPAFLEIQLSTPIATINRLVVHDSARNRGIASTLDLCRIDASRISPRMRDSFRYLRTERRPVTNGPDGLMT